MFSIDIGDFIFNDDISFDHKVAYIIEELPRKEEIEYYEYRTALVANGIQFPRASFEAFEEALAKIVNCNYKNHVVYGVNSVYFFFSGSYMIIGSEKNLVVKPW